MLDQFKEILNGQGNRARAQRSSALVVIGFGTKSILRLTSNLILTRLLFPEAFGLMALVFVFLTALNLFSDVGLNVSIVQNKRGEDPAFLNTIWSLQIIRGFILFLGSCALAYPAALIYEEPLLIQLLPAAGLAVIISGFATTKVALADRYLQLGMVTAIDIATQVTALIITVVLAWITQSVWSLVIGTVLGALLKMIAQHLLLKGPSNRWLIERAAVWDVLHFGKFIFLSSIAGFLVVQSDRAILGAYVSFSELGIFAVGIIFAGLPMELARTIGGKVIFPLFSKFPTKENAENRKKVLKARRLTLFAFAGLSALLSLISVPMIHMLYDVRYHDAGAILALMGFTGGAFFAQSNYEGAFLAAGDSWQQFRLTSIEAVLQVSIALLLISRFGTLGAVFSFGTTMLVAYPFRAHIAWKYNAWDPKTDLAALSIAWAGAILALYLWWEDISAFVLANLS